GEPLALAHTPSLGSAPTPGAPILNGPWRKAQCAWRTYVGCRALKRIIQQLQSNTTLADFSRARDSQITFSVTHGWSAFWRGRPWLAGRRIGETSSDVGSSRFWIGWVTKHGDKCARSTCRD